MRPWDETKNKINQRRHKVSFEAAMLAFGDRKHITVEDYVGANGEMRYQTIGLVGGVLIFVAHAFRVIDNIETPRLIMARKANHYEETLYTSHNQKD